MLYFGDLHERLKAPAHRKDDFRNTLNLKIEEIRELGNKHQVKAFLQPGDFLDKPKVSPEFLSDVVKRWGFADIQDQAFQLATGEVDEQVVSQRMRGFKPIVGAIGNHELHGEALKSYPKTSLALLEQLGFMHIPQKDEPIIFRDEEGFTVAITAGHYDIHMDDPNHLDVYIVEEKLADFHIHIVHGYLTNKDMGNLFPHTPLDLIAKKTKADLTLAGHDHIGFKPVQVDGKWFANTGAITRLTSDKKEIRRKPKVLLIDINKDSGVSLRQIYLKSAEKGEDVLDRSHLAFQKSMSDKLEEIKSVVNKSKVGSGLSITEIIRAISDSRNLDESLKDKAIAAVTDKMDSISHTTTPVQPYYIERIVLQNFQSHKNTVIELADGMNVLVGKSSAGKSAIVRALAWVIENESKNPRRYIKVGEDMTSVSLHLSTGTIITRLVEKKKNGKNGYEVYDAITGDVTFYNTKSLPLIQEYLGFSGLAIDEKKSIPLNFQKQGMSWFFIGDGFTNSDRAKIIGAIYQTHYVDAVIKDLESQAKKTKIRLKEKQENIKKTEEEIEKYNHLPSLKQTIEQVEKRMESLVKLEERLEKTKSLAEELNQLEKEIKENEGIVVRYKDIEKAEIAFRKWERKTEKLVNIKEIYGLQREILSEIENQKDTVNTYKNIPQLEERLRKAEGKIKEYQVYCEKAEKAKTLANDLHEQEQEIKKTNNIIESYKDLDDWLRRIQLLEKKLQVIQKAKPLVVDLESVTEKGLQERALLKSLSKENEQMVKKYESLLKQIGTCPVCQSNVDYRMIDNITHSYKWKEIV